ncbi:hypothetical protein EDD65_11252 [Keratinibaculum paraultunense]|uniref:Uncharacterized protein n=1 Tax=Keratinibaculum paraultunense TaxID=1278232 RepID=A0A4R3KRL8_9FIRM|nr:hypothetical protein [Keratinibaculum paraultunense]QQY79670.1 hypothetical protein JL105_10900 [Keratinibaculum paraultunense]TCS87094.1 hypothetical protein EDD65_11252 [Keratinibaculum paraultunense]
MKIAKVIFSLIVIISAGVVIIIKSPYEPRLKPYMIIVLLLISIIDGRVFTRQREKDKDTTTFLIKFIALIGLLYLLL